MIRHRSTVFVFLSAVLFATGGLFFKKISWNALAISSARSVIAGLFILSVMLITRHRFRITKSVIFAALSISVTNNLYALANKLTTAGNTIVLQFSMPVFVILIMAVFYRKKPSALEIVTCFAVLGGIVCFFIDSLTAGNMLGNALALISGVSYACFFIFNSREDSEPFTAVLLSYALTALIGLPWLLRTDVAATPGSELLCVLALGLLQQGTAQICFALGIKETPPVAASLISGIEPILNPVLVALFYGEKLTLLSLIGAAVVLLAVLVYNVITASKKATADAGG
ncbi:MAG: EamA family transporter [Clostridia bacterium]|nr:EamA family transporter [Clostridia bacterium]